MSLKIGHVRRGTQEIFVKRCIDNTAWKVSALCVTASERSYASSKIYGFKMKVIIDSPDGIEIDRLNTLHQTFMDTCKVEFADAARRKKTKPTKSALTVRKLGHNK